MHNGVIEALRLQRLRFVPLELSDAAVAPFLRSLRGAGNILGANVTIPHKERAAAEADDRSEAVAFCGAANTLVVRDGRIRAENTDGAGFLDALAESGLGRRFRKVAMLGAGGAARGVAYALAGAGTRDMVILNRDPLRADAVAASLSPAFAGLSIRTGRLDRASMAKAFADADLIVQGTSLGLTEPWVDFPLESVSTGAVFADLVYGVGGRSLVRQLKKRGVAAIDGLPMLAAQAARSFSLWTGRRPKAGLFLSIALKSLSNRSPKV